MSLELLSSLWDWAVDIYSGIDMDSILIGLFILTFLAILFIMAKRFTTQSTEYSGILDTDIDQLAPFNSDCPVCLEELLIGAEGNCGHVYCTRCIKELDRRRNWRYQIVCPMCRQKVQILFKYVRPDTNIEDTELIELINEYNSFSLSRYPQNIWDTIQNMPTLLRHLMQRFIETGFRFDQMLGSALVLISLSLGYFFLPSDLFPEIVFGLYGLIDDFFVAFYCLFQICIFYRNFLAHTGET